MGANKKAAISGGLLVNAGNHLRSHTLTRAVPSAQRGLTSVFGMGTGDPSQYAHRQTWRHLAGGCPQLAAASAILLRMFSRQWQERGCNLAPTT